MHIISEELDQEIMTAEEAFTSIESVFAAMAKEDAYNFPVIREAIGYADALYGFKSGFDRVGKTLGLKAGGYWPGNMDKGLTNHQSTVFLFDPDTGQPQAMVGGNYLTAIPTAAAAAVSVKHLSREDSKVLGIVGAGHQSTFQLRAVVAQRNFEKIVRWNIDESMLTRLSDVADELGLPFESVSRETMGEMADVIITITSCQEPLLMRDWISPGTHLACMGTDTKGKQEVDPALIAAATTFTDEVAQSISIGECQHAVGSGLIKASDVNQLGSVINGDHPGRSSADEITLFDGTGVGLQDLAVAATCFARAVEAGKALEVSV